jgi:hypothetical protein
VEAINLLKLVSFITTAAGRRQTGKFQTPRSPGKAATTMTSVRKKPPSDFRTPRWLRGPPTYLRSLVNGEELSIYRSMRNAVIQELRPKTPIEWILVNEFVNEQFSAMRCTT